MLHCSRVIVFTFKIAKERNTATQFLFTWHSDKNFIFLLQEKKERKEGPCKTDCKLRNLKIRE